MSNVLVRLFSAWRMDGFLAVAGVALIEEEAADEELTAASTETDDGDAASVGMPCSSDSIFDASFIYYQIYFGLHAMLSTHQQNGASKMIEEAAKSAEIAPNVLVIYDINLSYSLAKDPL
ncbi:hypothetical protein MPSEU_000865900 [Mayamaea pseudoterrestris]|nr:hypothetical protein MPSEU_000865900 [Mayamaea pseudoterrestris]